MATSILPRVYRPGGVVSFHARGPHAAAACRLDGDVPLTVVPMSIAELRQYDWLIDVLREEGYHGDIVGGNVYFADTGAFLGCFFGDGRRVHVEWWDDVTLNDLEFVAEVRTAQIALNYMVNRWDSAHGRVLPVREPWESDESLASRRRAVLEAHTVAGRPAPSAQTLADAIAKAEAEAAERERAEAKKRADYLATVRGGAFGFEVTLFEPYHIIDLAKAGRPGGCEYGRCTLPAPVAIEVDPWTRRGGSDQGRRSYRACAFHFLNAVDAMFAR
ncbi:hypothetical protein [Streptomyces sp. NPDC056672]|uniref:hypothetical protein n=1 Tax=Streptomyces sp. NPDC056672 TaxID=3345906 RepID=UPI0036972C62